MARDYARVRLDIWSDSDFRRLSAQGQHLYLLLMTSPSLTYCGVTDWRPGRIAALTQGLRPEHVMAAGCELAAAHYVVIDLDTEEVLLRSFIRHDGLMKEPRMGVALAKAWAATASETIRGVVVHEMQRLREEDKTLGGWFTTKGAPGQALDVLKGRAVDPAEIMAPVGVCLADVSPAFGPNPVSHLADVWHPPTPTPSPTPSPATPTEVGGVGGGTRKKPSRPIPEDWAPTSAHYASAAPGIDVEREAAAFRAHALANDRRLSRWDQGFTQWLLKARPTSRQNQTPTERAAGVAEMAARLQAKQDAQRQIGS